MSPSSSLPFSSLLPTPKLTLLNPDTSPLLHNLISPHFPSHSPSPSRCLRPSHSCCFLLTFPFPLSPRSTTCASLSLMSSPSHTRHPEFFYSSPFRLSTRAHTCLPSLSYPLPIPDSSSAFIPHPAQHACLPSLIHPLPIPTRLSHSSFYSFPFSALTLEPQHSPVPSAPLSSPFSFSPYNAFPYTRLSHKTLQFIPLYRSVPHLAPQASPLALSSPSSLSLPPASAHIIRALSSQPAPTLPFSQCLQPLLPRHIFALTLQRGFPLDTHLFRSRLSSSHSPSPSPLAPFALRSRLRSRLLLPSPPPSTFPLAPPHFRPQPPNSPPSLSYWELSAHPPLFAPLPFSPPLAPSLPTLSLPLPPIALPPIPPTPSPLPSHSSLSLPFRSHSPSPLALHSSLSSHSAPLPSPLPSHSSLSPSQPAPTLSPPTPPLPSPPIKRKSPSSSASPCRSVSRPGCHLL
ncbi:hypothetical protein C7M84_022503 [Penaeus vannamei]|uniref:Uncharacterized protein n=1 Tax=Penaeus vannamei TaxID=6689 RepID=A0A423U6K2_PENVA|nr:hypothetical protein C7M84_022503 [Penaeus vannamei]